MSKWGELEEALSYAQEELTRRKAQRDVLLSEKKRVEEEWHALDEKRELLEKVRILLQQTADHARQQAKVQLETIVTRALRYVFGSSFRFEIVLTEHGGNPTAEFYVVTEWDGKEIKNKPQDARGGGVVDLLSLALRVALIESIKPRVQGPVILDEPGKHVSEDYIVPFVELIKSLSDTFQRQIIMVTHNTDLTESADLAFDVRLNKGVSVVRQLRLLDNANE